MSMGSSRSVPSYRLPHLYYESKVREADPSRLPARARRDIELRGEISRVWPVSAAT
jgi:hypothetical protein